MAQLENSLANIMERKKKKSHSIEEASYLYGFVDPANASRGPMRSEHPTVIGTLTSSSTISIGASAALPVPYTFLTDPTYTLTGTVGVDTGDINIACGTCMFADKNTTPGATGSTLVPAFAFPPNRPLTARTIGTITPGVSALMPIGSYTADWPGSWSNGIANEFEKIDGTVDNAYRMLGCRSTVSVNSSLLTSYGQVYVSDNGSYYPDTPADNYYLTTGEIVDEPIIEDVDLYATTFGHGEKTNRTVNAGPFKYGATYEAAFVPTNDSITRYRQRFPSHVTATSSVLRSHLGQPFLNGPFTIYSFVGIPRDSVITINTTVSFEIPVRLRSQVGWLMANARLSSNYMVDWSLLAKVPTGGKPGTALLAMVSDPVGQIGMGVATGHFPEPSFARPVNIGIVTPSATQLVTTASLLPDGDIEERLTAAADGSETPASHFARVSNALSSTSHREKMARVVALAQQLYGYGKMANNMFNAAMSPGTKKIAHAAGQLLIEAVVPNGIKQITGNSKGKKGNFTVAVQPKKRRGK